MTLLEKYNNRVDKVNSLLCVGLDTDFEKLPEKFKKLERPQFEFNKYIIEQTHEYAATFKPNIAFYEAQGLKGIEDLEMTAEYIHKNFPDVFTILDSKRADIGNTNQGYVTEAFDWLGFDAVTVNPYFGVEALKPFFARKDKIIMVLCRTSNPGAGEIQDLIVNGKPLWVVVTEKMVKEWNYNNNCMAVFGATYPEELRQAREILGEMTILSPGSQAQGGNPGQAAAAGLNSEKKGMMINSSRGILFSENPAEEAKRLRDEINKYR